MKSFARLTVLLLFMAQIVSAGPSIYEIALKDIDKKDTSLKSFKGKVLLVVNVASQCGLTPQYKALEKMHQQYKAKGFAVLGFPCNDFGAQEPGTNEEIKQFCSSKYNVTFPIFDKLSVKGPEQHPLYQLLAGKDAKFAGDVKWNFGKFLVGKNGEVLRRFEPRTAPDDPEVVKAIEEALAAAAK